MENQDKIDTKIAQTAGAAQSKKWKSLVCIILCVALLLIVGLGCASYVSIASVHELQADMDQMLNDMDSIRAAYIAVLQELSSVKSAQNESEAGLKALLQQQQQAHEAAQAEAATKAQIEINLLQASIQAAKNETAAQMQEQYEAAQQEIVILKGQLEELLLGLDTSEKIKIYIDQGHNPTSYHNSGSSGNGLHEQDLTFTIGILLAELLEEDGRFEVRLSRPTQNTVLGTDNDSSLDARVKGAIDFGADYFISLHINAYDDATVNGIEVYVAEQSSESYSFGSNLLQALAASTNLQNRGMKLNPNFRVLKNTTMPAALLEMGFISNAADAAVLSAHPEWFAEGIYNGILSHFALEPQEQ